jgi:CheY-like chemotaxis protein/HPt (histidine-containing phosphotransfer) domain-containing protein
LTRSGQRGDAERCREIGVSGYLAKPVGPLDLLDTIRAVMGKSTATEDETLVTRHSLRESRPRMDVLVAEANDVNRLVIRTLLEKSGHEVTLVTTGREALEALERKPFDVILMDVRMPEMDGIEATREVRAREKATQGHTPIVALAARAATEDRAELAQAGMDDCLAKPFEPGELFEMLERFMPAGDAARRADDSGRAHDRTSGADQPIVDRRQLMEQTGGDPHVLRQMVDMFLRETPALLHGVRRAVERGDGRSLERAAQKLKTTCGALAARLVADAAERLEQMGGRGDLSRVKEVYELLESRIGRLETELLAIARPWGP